MFAFTLNDTSISKNHKSIPALLYWPLLPPVAQMSDRKTDFINGITRECQYAQCRVPDISRTLPFTFTHSAQMNRQVAASEMLSAQIVLSD